MDRSSKIMEPHVDRISNMSEVLAMDVDVEESSEMFYCGLLAARPRAPEFAAGNGSRKRRHSSEDIRPPFSKPAPGPFSSQIGTVVADPAKPWQTIHQKYSDIFAPLDFSAPKRDSLSSTASSTDLEPTSVGTRASTLTVDTCYDSEKAPSPPFSLSPRSDYKSQHSWLDSDDVVSPITLRRRSSMSDFPRFKQLLRRPTETETIASLSALSTVDDLDEEPGSPMSADPRSSDRRPSSAMNPEVRDIRQQFARYASNMEKNRQAAPLLTPTSAPSSTGESRQVERRAVSSDGLASPFLYSNRKESIASSLLGGETNGRRLIASSEVGFDEWLRSDMAQQFPSGDQVLPRPLPANVQEMVKFYVNNFPEPMLLCNSLLVENIRGLSHKVRFNTDNLRSDGPTSSGNQSGHQHKLSKWKWLKSSDSSALTDAQLHRELSEATPSKQEWSVMRNIFPHGSDGLCEALYAYVLVYNYVTSLCLRSPAAALDPSRPTTPWIADTNHSPNLSEESLASASLRTPGESGAVPRKAASILGLAGDDTGTTRPSSRTSLRNSPFGFRAMPSLLFNGSGQGQRRGESRGTSGTRPTTPAVSLTGRSQPGTPDAGGPFMRPKTPAAPRGAEQAKQLVELRHGLAMCCARLTVTLHRADPKVAKLKSDKDYKVDPSFMRSLCEIVRATEDTIGRCQ